MSNLTIKSNKSKKSKSKKKQSYSPNVHSRVASKEMSLFNEDNQKNIIKFLSPVIM
jgi:hypothetical protein